MNDKINPFTKYLSTHPSLLKSFNKDSYEKEAIIYQKKYGRFLHEDTTTKILDVGCGQGSLLYWLKEKNYSNIMGIDISSEQITFCEKHINVPVKCIPIQEYFLSTDDLYDMIFILDVLELIQYEEILDTLILIREHLNRKGMIIVQVPNMGNPFNLDARYCEFFHREGFTAGSLSQALELSGFNEIQMFSESDIENYHAAKQIARKIIIYFIGKLFSIPFDFKSLEGRFPYGRRISCIGFKAKI